MNKKITTLFLSGVAMVLPALAFGATLTGIATSVQTTITTVAGSIVFIGWIVAGILYLTSAGDPSKTKTAKDAIIACTIGTLLVILAGASGAIMGVIKNAFGL